MKDILITSSVLILAILLIRTLFRGSISRRMQYALWLLAALRLLIPFNLAPAGYSVLNTVQWIETRGYRALQAVPTLQLTRGAVKGYDDSIIIPESPASAERDTEPEEPEQARAAFDIRRCVRPVWYGGMAVMAVWFLSANLRFARKLRRTRIPLDNVKSRNPVCLCDDVPAPCLFGLIRPVIYVTSAAARDRASLECVIAHEETHAKHLDPLWSLIRIVCLVIYWFDPLVWLAAHCSRVDSEFACDEGTIARLGESERVFYGRTLLALVPVRRGGSSILTATTMISGKRHMRDRIRRIAEYKRPAAAALVIALLLSGAAFAATITGAESVISGKTSAEEQMLSIAQEMATGLVRRASDRFLFSYYTQDKDILDLLDSWGGDWAQPENLVHGYTAFDTFEDLSKTFREAVEKFYGEDAGSFAGLNIDLINLLIRNYTELARNDSTMIAAGLCTYSDIRVIADADPGKTWMLLDYGEEHPLIYVTIVVYDDGAASLGTQFVDLGDIRGQLAALPRGTYSFESLFGDMAMQEDTEIAEVIKVLGQMSITVY